MANKKEIKRLIASAQSISGKLSSFENYLNSLPDNITDEHLFEELSLRLSDIKRLANNYEEICIDLSALSVDTSGITNADEFYDKFAALSSKATVLLNKKLSICNSSEALHSNSIQSNNSINARLPKISLPTFQGNYQDFTSFYETFKALVHDNQSLTDVERFLHLRSSLKAEASQLIANVQPTSANYKVAFDLLCERYNNPKCIIQSHVKGIFDLKPIGKENASDLRKLHDELNKHIRSLQNFGMPIDHCSMFIVHILFTKFDNHTKVEFSKLKPRDILTLTEIDDFLKARCELLEQVDNSKATPSNHNTNCNNTNVNKFRGNNYKQSFILTNQNNQCLNCQQDHTLARCPSFLNLSVKQRFDKTTELKVCRNCLSHSSFKKCNSKFSCQKCNKRHHSLLHFENIAQPTSSQLNNTSSCEPSTSLTEAPVQTALSCFSKMPQILLSTACVKVRDVNNKWHTVRAVLDSASHANFVSEELANKLGVKREKLNTKVLGLNSCMSQSNFSVNIQVASMHTNYHVVMQCLTASKIADNLPLMSFNKSALNLPKNIRLADNNFNKSMPVDILIGAGYFYDLLCIGQIKLGKNMPVLQKTLFGWVISGIYQYQNKNNLVYSNFTLNTNLDCSESFENSIQEFWRIEEVRPQNKLSLLSAEERFCEEYFDQSISRDASGRFIVSIPFNSKLIQLGYSKQQAVDRFQKLERKLLRNHNLYNEYSAFIQEYLRLGHMSKISVPVKGIECQTDNIIQTFKNPVNIANIPPFYLPHHAVLKASSLTTKLRVVFDGSAHSSSGISINDAQIVGPIIQDDLFSILLRFRQHQFALIGDIEKCYRQILVQPSERKFQRILWRDDPKSPIDVYELNTVTYGTASASYLTTKCLQYLANINYSKFPKACEILKTSFYMDDLLTGANTLEEVKEIQTELTSILSSAGFPIRKFLSNSSELLLNDESSNLQTIPLGERENAKTLGLSWNSVSDIIQYDSNYKSNFTNNSKRAVLSTVAQLFDPLGFLSPFIIVGKLIIQKLWQLGLAWDESIPENLHSEFNSFKTQLPLLNKIYIPRCVLANNAISIEIHGFSDSSSYAYGAVVYIKCTNNYNNIKTQLLCAKSRVAPLHGATIPRLELCAAVLLAQLVQKVKNVLNINFTKTYLWTDSSIVLNWISSAPNKYKVFVANRIAAIQEMTNIKDWYHVPSKLNPADLISRGCSATTLTNNSLWWHGPHFLNLPPDQWPAQNFKSENLPCCEIKSNIHTTLNFLNIESVKIFDKYSSLMKLQRVVAWMFRFSNNSKLGRSERSFGTLKVPEIQNSLNVLIKICQAETFSKELQCLKSKKILKTTSNILSLNPFLDDNEIIRVGGRIKNSEYHFSKKFPILLPKNHSLTNLVFQQFHTNLLHCGAQQLLASVREYYWPIAGRNCAKQIVHNCIKCFKANPKSVNPLMGNLPAKRLECNTSVFHNVGIDYAGPIMIKDRKTRGARYFKSYICLFVCLVTRAVHLELVTDLSTEAFIATLRRFVSRRGKPNTISSDNATNFVGASNELRELNQFLKADTNREAISNFLANQSIKWEFITPRAPFQGGIWESGIKSVKTHLKRVFGNTNFTFEEFYTALIQIEGVLNSRPLCPISSDPDDLTPITPGHFLIGKALCSIPDPNLLVLNENKLSTYQRIQQLVQTFWKRWSLEVVPELQKRTKWFQNLPQLLKVGSIVLIKEDNMPPLQWALGRVTELHPGADNVLRAVTLRTSNGHHLKRAVHKLCALPKSD